MKKFFINTLFILIAVSLGLGAGALGILYVKMPHNEELQHETEVYVSENHTTEITLNQNATTSSGDVAVHFLELGNKYTGDCTYIKVGENVDILIDCGSRSSSIAYVKKYLDEYVNDVADDGKKILDYVIVTHAHQDHYAGFATSNKTQSIFDLFYCNNIIYFSTITDGKSETKTYKNWERELNQVKGYDQTSMTEITPNKYTALQCVEKTDGASRVFTLDETNEITLEILDHKYIHEADRDNENNNSVCCMVNQGDKNFLFTGDLEGEYNTSKKQDGEFSLIEMNNLPKVELLKAGHHGSKTSSSTAFLDVVLDKNKPAIVCICCCAGSIEYTTNVENTFPTKEFVERISQYTTLVYVTTLCEDYKNGKFTSFNGNITVISSGTNTIEVKCSNNTTLLKDSKWFKENRLEMCYSVLPDSWK